MAGSYPDAPSRRMAIDADGTVGVRTPVAGGVSVMLTPANMATLNDEDTGGVSAAFNNTAVHWAFVFPELREVDGVFFAFNNGGLTVVETSADTTNGVDGTWSTVYADYAEHTPATSVIPFYRTAIRSAATAGARALRVLQGAGGGNTPSLLAAHIYGEISPGETPDRLLFLDENTGLEFTLPIDFGDVPRGSSEDVELRLRNNSATLTASNIQYTAEALPPDDSGNHYTFTLPGGSTFQSTQQVASLAPATTSGLITVRRITPGSAAVGLRAGRIRATTQTWS